MTHVVCAGVITVDFVFHLGAPPHHGQKHRASATGIQAGGCAYNAAAAIARLGGSVTLAGVVGDDMLGHLVRDELKRHGIGDRLVATLPGASTSRSAVVVTPDGERTIINHRDPRLFEQSLVLPDDFAVDTILVDTRWPTGARSLLEAARRRDITALVDAEAPMEGLADTLALASHVAFSEQGLADLAGSADAAALARAAAMLGTWTCVTRGPSSVLCHDGTTLSESPAFRVEAVDTLGAGDVWHGAFALALAQRRPLADALRFANAVAALKTRRTNHLPDIGEVEQFLKENIA